MRSLIIILLAACADNNESIDPHAPSGPVAAWDDRVAVSDVDRSSVWLKQILASDLEDELHLDGIPGRMARVDTDLYVLLTDRGQLVHIDASDGLTEVARVPVGADPTDVIAHNDSLIVALGSESAVVKLDRETLQPTHRWKTDGAPTWLASDPASDRVFAAHADQPTVAELSDGETRIHTVPQVQRFPNCTSRLLQARITGAPVWSENTDRLFVPTTLLDTQLIEHRSNTYEGCNGTILIEQYYAPPLRKEIVFDRLTPAITVFDTETQGSVLPLVDLDLDEPSVRGTPGDLLVISDWSHETRIAVPLSNADAVVHLSVPLHVETQTLVPLEVERGPEGVQSWAHHRAGVVAWSPYRHTLLSGPVHGLTPLATPDSLLDPDLQRGRELFHSAVEPLAVAPGAGMSCNVCHPSGGSDGLTWLFEDFPRQTPSLQGGVAHRAPFTWTGTVETVEDEAMATSSMRMGGALNEELAGMISSYLGTLPAPSPAPIENRARWQLGQQVFHRAEVGCATCHSGPDGSDGRTHQVLGFDVATATPHLAGIARTAPYLHDGSAKTLEQVLERAADGSMGDTSSLTADEHKSLVYFLERW